MTLCSNLFNTELLSFKFHIQFSIYILFLQEMNNIAIVFDFENPVDVLNRFIRDFQIVMSSVCEAHIQPHPLLWTIFDRTSWKQITTQRHENILLHNAVEINYYTTSWKQITTQHHENKLLRKLQRHENKLLHTTQVTTVEYNNK
jgi:hypothetical protein